MFKSISNISLSQVMEQGYFDFCFDFHQEITAEEKALLDLMDNLNYKKFNYNKRLASCKLDAKVMCILIIYAAMKGCNSSRKIEELSRRNTFLISLIGPNTEIDHTTINRFKKNNEEAFEDLLTQIAIELHKRGEIKGESIFQDGTKIESRSGKYTFVWKSGLEKNGEKCLKRIDKICEVSVEKGVIKEEEKKDTVGTLQLILTRLKDVVVDDKNKGRGERRDFREKIKERAEIEYKKLKEIDENLSIIGNDRKSMSKTDNDATFMRMKEDAMKNGQLKPAYNIQNAVDSGYIIATTISSDRTDYRTCIPMMNKVQDIFSWKYENYCADSGYDLLENYKYLEKEGIKAFIKPQDWDYNKKRKIKNDIGLYKNMQYNSKGDFFICSNNKRLKKQGEKKKDNTTYSFYKCTRGCKSCHLRAKCIGASSKDKNKKKSFSVAIEHWKYREKARKLLSSDLGIQMRLNRSIMVEGSFAQTKANKGFRRFLTFGRYRSFIDWIILLISYDISHYANRRYNYCLEDVDWYTPPENIA